MSDSDEILFDDIYELHEVIGKRIYFLERCRETLYSGVSLLSPRLLFITHFLANIIA